MIEDVLGGIRVAEAHVVERDLGTGIARGRKFSILRNSGVGIADRGLAFEHFLDALAATSARGSIIESMPIMRKPMMMTIE